ncbi:Rv3654c family TadE-like protein [Janibacter sp. GXQ6167]|uniref:Rv3654c family TadE-like protein n=1 Tax=Janibacter sp. GXQ6167 TaxID=3240791 RepID=UPI003524C542
MTRRLGAGGEDSRGERGSGTVLAVGVVAVVLTITLAVLAVVSAVNAGHHARAAADLGALAGAMRYQTDPGGACGEASRVAALNGGALEGCVASPDGRIEVTVTSRVAWRVWGLGRGEATARAVAGPDDTEAPP